jgi:hypothetical protein
MLNLILIFFIIIIIFLVFKNILLFYLPTLTWFSFMVIPYIYTQSFVNFATAQIIGIFMFLFIFFVGDFFSQRHSKLKRSDNFDYQIMSKSFFKLLVIFCLAIPLIHLLIVRESPIFELLVENRSLKDISEARYNFNRGGIPYWFALLGNWLISFFGPILITYALIMKKYLLSIISFLYILVYSIMAGARAPLVFFITALLLSFAFTNYKAVKPVSVIFSFLFLFTIFSGLLIGEKALSQQKLCPIPKGVNVTPSNILRSCDNSETISINKISDSLGYRIFLVPIEVSSKWYEYYREGSANTRTGQNILGRSNELKSSNLVAKEYYTKYWPDRYPMTTNANASIDADAFSIGGLVFTLVIGLVILFFRLGMNYLLSLETLLTRLIYGIGLTFLSILPVSGSIQSIFISQGYWIIFTFTILKFIKIYIAKLRIK